MHCFDFDQFHFKTDPKKLTMENETTNQQEKTETRQVAQIQLPNSSGVLAMGIISIVCFCCLAAGLVGITLGILAIVLGNKAIILYEANPDQYTQQSYKNTKAGRVCGIIGLSVGGIWLIGILIYLSIIGWAIGTIFSILPWNMIH